MPARKASKRDAEEKSSAKAAAKAAKQGSAPPSRDERAAAFAARFNHTMKGHGMVKKASEYSLPYMTRRLPTGILSVDLELRGGFPAGGLSQIAGPKNAGKSFLYWQMIRQLQHFLGEKMKVLLVMIEMRADRAQGRLAGVKIALADVDIAEMNKGRVENGQSPMTKEEVASLKTEVGTIDEMHGESAEILYDGILDAVENDVYHLIVIDSFGSIMSELEAESESTSDKQYGGASGVNTKFCRKLSALLTIDDDYGNARKTCLIGVNQIRDNLNDPHKEWRTPGGRALEHTKFVDLWVRSGKQLSVEQPVFTQEGWKKKWVMYGKEVNWNIEKGKAGIHEGGKGGYKYRFDINSVDFYDDTLVVGVQLGIVEQSGAWLGIRDPANPNAYLVRAQGRDAFVTAMVEDATAKQASGDSANSIMNYIRSQAFQKSGIFISYDWE